MADDKLVQSAQRALRKLERSKTEFLDHGKNSEGDLGEKFAKYQKAHKSYGKALEKVESA